MKIFITGASGFIGGHVSEILSKNHDIVAMARSERSEKAVQKFGATPIRCALNTITAEHVTGCDAVVHCAAFVEEWGTREQFWEANVIGTNNVLHAAKEAGVQRFIHIGTEAALFNGDHLIDIDETFPYPKKPKYLYSETKGEAERLVLAANTDDFVTISIRPRLVWGPRDNSVLPAILDMAKAGKWMWLDKGVHETSTTHVYNLVRGVELALENGTPGSAYFVADEERSTMRSFLTALVETQNVSLSNGSLPGTFARGLATSVEFVWRFFGAKTAPPLIAFSTAMMSRSVTVDVSRAKRELGYEPIISTQEGLNGMTL